MDVFEAKDKESITTRIVVPNTPTKTERYYALLNRASQLNQKFKDNMIDKRIKSLHAFARTELDQLMDNYEAALKELEAEAS